MRRIIINCLLLASIVTAVPDGRHKRHFAFIRDLITSSLFGETQTTIVEPQAEYKLYRVPGFDDVLVKATLDLPKETTTVIKPDKEVLEIHPFEAYIGTEDKQDTIMAFEHVNNLLSTGVLNRKQSKLMQETISPMLSGVNDVKIVAKERITPIEVVSKPVQRILTKNTLPNEVKVFPDSRIVEVKAVPAMYETIAPQLTEVDATVKLEVPVKPRYSFTQMEKNEAVTTYTQLGPKLSVRQRVVDASPVLPMCIKQRIDEVASIGAIPQRRVAINGGFSESRNVAVERYPYEANRFTSLKPRETIKVGMFPEPIHGQDSWKTVVQQTVPHSPVIHYIQPKHTHISSKPFQEMYNIKSETVKSNSASVAKSSKTISETNVKESKDGTVPYYSYRQVNNKEPQVPSIQKESDKLHISNPVENSPAVSSTPNVINYVNVAKPNNPLKTSGTISQKPVSNYVYKQISNNNPSGIHIAKEKEETDYTPKVLNYVNVAKNNNPSKSSSTASTFNYVFKPISHNISNGFHIAKEKEESDDTPKVINYVNVAKNNNPLKTSGSASTHEPASNYVYKQITSNNLNGFHIAKEKEESDPPLSNQNRPTSTLGESPKLRNNVNFNKTTEHISMVGKNESKGKPILKYVSKQVHQNNSNVFSIAKESDRVNSDSSLPNHVRISHVTKIPTIMTGSNTRKNTENIARTNDFGQNVLQLPGSGAVDKTLSQYIYKQLSHNNPPAFSILAKEDEVKSNPNTDSSIPKNYVYMPPNINSSPPIIPDHKLKNNYVKNANVAKDRTLSQYITKQITHHLSHSLSSLEKKNEPNPFMVYVPPVIGKSPIINSPVPVTKSTQTPREPTSQFVYKQNDLNNQNVFSMVKEGNDVKTNIVTDSVPVGNTTPKVDDVKDFTVAEVASSSESATEGDKKGILGISPVLKENGKITFKDNPIVVADLNSNYKYHQSNVDGSLLSVKGNKEGVAINVDRGDIRK